MEKLFSTYHKESVIIQTHSEMARYYCENFSQFKTAKAILQVYLEQGKSLFDFATYCSLIMTNCLPTLGPSFPGLPIGPLMPGSPC